MKKKKSADKKKPAPAVKDFTTNKKLHLILISLISFLLYANTFTHGYAQDDAIVITDNMFTKDGIKGIKGLLTKDTFFGFFKVEGKESLVAGGRYRPLSLITFAIEQEIFGDNASIRHIINAIMYAFLCILIYLSTIKFFENTRIKKSLPFFAFLASIIFAFHPIHTEAVANIKGRDEIMAFLLGLSAIYLLFSNRFSPFVRMIFSGVLFFLAMMSKENAITLIPIGFLVFWYLRDHSILDSMKRVSPIIAGTFLFLVIRFSILGWGVGEEPLEMMNNPFVKYENGSYAFFTPTERTAAIIYSLGWYIKLLVFPHPLTNDYYPRQVEVMELSNVWVVSAALLLVLIFALGIFFWKKNRLIAFSIFYFILTILIFSNIVFPIGTHLSERFLFMPSLAFCFLLAYAMWNIYYKFGSYVFYGVFLIILGLYGMKTILRNGVWKDDFTLYTIDVKTSSNSAKALNAAGGVLVNQSTEISDQQVKTETLNLAKQYLNNALAIHPNYKNAWLLLGNAYFYLKDYDQSIEAFDQALTIDPSYPDARKNIALALREGGKNAGEIEGNLSKARSYLTRSYQLNPNDPEINRLMGILESFSGNHQDAVRYYTRITQLLPNDKGGYILLYQAYSDMGDVQNAEINRRKALQIDPQAFNQ